MLTRAGKSCMPGVKDLKPRGTEMTRPSVLFGLYLLLQEFLNAEGVASHCQKDKVVELNVTAGRSFPLPIPENFSRDILCTWVIAAPEGLYVKLTIDKLKPKIDRQSSSLYIRDGRNSSSHLLKKPWDLGVKCTAVFSSGRYLWVQFSSKKASYDASGFKAVYTAVKSCLCPEDSANVILSKNCGPLSSYNCRSRHHKHWKRICCYMKNKGELRFDSFNPSDSKDCADEYLEIYHVRCFGSNRPASTDTKNDPDTRNEHRSNVRERTWSRARHTPARAKKDNTTTLLVCLSATTFVTVLSLVCYQCIRSAYNRDDDDTDVMNTLETECPQTSKEQETV